VDSLDRWRGVRRTDEERLELRGRGDVRRSGDVPCSGERTGMFLRAERSILAVTTCFIGRSGDERREEATEEEAVEVGVTGWGSTVGAVTTTGGTQTISEETRFLRRFLGEGSGE
jgi:hypothetical protein